MSRTQERGVQIDAATIYDRDHPPIAPAGLPVIFVHERLRSDLTGLSGELLSLRIAGLAYLGRVHQCQVNSGGTYIQRVAVDDVRDSVHEACSDAPTLRLVTRRVAGRISRRRGPW